MRIIMKAILPVSSFLLAVTAYYLKGIQGSMHWAIAKLFTTDTVNEQARSNMVGLNDQLYPLAILIALISLLTAIASIFHKFCNMAIGIFLIFVSVISILWALLIVF